MLAIADDIINCSSSNYMSDSEEIKGCDNDVTTCLSSTGEDYDSMKWYLLNTPNTSNEVRVQTIILYPNQSIDWSSINKKLISIHYYVNNNWAGTTQVFGSRTDRDIPESPIIITEPVVTSNLDGIYINMNVLCEIIYLLE